MVLFGCILASTAVFDDLILVFLTDDQTVPVSPVDVATLIGFAAHDVVQDVDA